MRIPQLVLVPCGDIGAVHPQRLERLCIIEIERICTTVIAQDQHMAGFQFRRLQEWRWLLIGLQPEVLVRVGGCQDLLRDLDGLCCRVQGELSVFQEQVLA